MPLRRSYGKRTYKRGWVSAMATRAARPGTRTLRWAKSRYAGKYTKVPFSKTVGNSIHFDRQLIDRGFMPPCMWTQHRYSENVQIANDNITGRTATEYAFRLGSLFDPNFTGVGHQPRGFDQMAAFYSKNVVYKVHVQIRVLGQTAGSSPYNFLAINVRNSESTYVLSGSKTSDEIQEVSNNTVMAIDPTGVNNKTFDQEFYLADVDGVAREKIFTDIIYEGGSTFNPQRTAYLSVATGNNDDIVSQAIRLQVNLVMYAKWYARATPAQS